VLGHLRERMPKDALLVVMSDHGFETYRRKFSLNTWLLEQGYLVLKPGRAKELPRRDPNFSPVHLSTGFGAVDWTKTRAYGVGFNALYLTLAGRGATTRRPTSTRAGSCQPGASRRSWPRSAGSEAPVDEKTGGRPALRSRARRYHGPRVLRRDPFVGYDAGWRTAISRRWAGSRTPSRGQPGGTFNGNHLMCPTQSRNPHDERSRAHDHGLEDRTVRILRHRPGGRDAWGAGIEVDRGIGGRRDVRRRQQDQARQGPSRKDQEDLEVADTARGVHRHVLEKEIASSRTPRATRTSRRSSGGSVTSAAAVPGTA
jgi:hypothetical protein